MKTTQLSNGQVLVIRKAVIQDAPRMIQYLERIAQDTEFLTFGPGELTLSVIEEEKLIKESCNGRGVFISGQFCDYLHMGYQVH